VRQIKNHSFSVCPLCRAVNFFLEAGPVPRFLWRK